MRHSLLCALFLTMTPGAPAAGAVPMAMTSAQAFSAIENADSAVVELVTPRFGVGPTAGAPWQRSARVLLRHGVMRDWTMRFANELGRVGVYSRFTRCAHDDEPADEARPRFRVMVGDSANGTWVWLDFAKRCAEVGSVSRPGGTIALDFEPNRLLALVSEGLGVSDSAAAAIEKGASTRPHGDTHKGKGDEGYVFVETLPEVISRIPPEYPFDANLANVHGIVRVQALVDRSGVVADLFVLDSIPLLDVAAVESVRQWKFKPATADGKPVGVWVVIPVKFTLR